MGNASSIELIVVGKLLLLEGSSFHWAEVALKHTPTSARTALCNSCDHDFFNMAPLKDRDHPPRDSWWRLHTKNCFTPSFHDIVFRCPAFLALHSCMSDFVAILKMPKPAIGIDTPWERRPFSWFQPLHHLWAPIFPLSKWDFCFETSSLNFKSKTHLQSLWIPQPASHVPRNSHWFLSGPSSQSCFSSFLYSSAQPRNKYHWLGSLNKHLFSHSSETENWKPEIKYSQD